MRVLIVDDDIVDREGMVRAIKHNTINAFISETDSLAEAIELIATHTYDVVLLDYNLPKSIGIDPLIQLKEKSCRPSVAIVVVSISTDEQIALSCIKAGAQDFLVKTEITSFLLNRAIVNAQARSDLERNLIRSYNKTKELAEHDSLTGLTNRYYFDETLKRELHNHTRSKKYLALLLFDLDHFKYVNDNFGHDVGDKLLIEVTKRLGETLRENEFFSRLGGDEFAITVKDIHEPSVAATVAKRLLDKLTPPFTFEQQLIHVSASIGIAIYPTDGDNEKALLKYADIAMYRAKDLGRNQFSFFEKTMQEEFLASYLIENQLKQAIQAQKFFLHYQPLICSNSGELIGVEALIRLTLDQKGLSPAEFIPIAEKSHLIFEIGKWVIESAIQQLHLWNKKRQIPLTMAINLSSVQLADQSLVTTIKKQLDYYRVPANLIELELTETALLADCEETSHVIKELSKLGCKISLDDFGTGYSSISHLHTFPINIVKIDKSLMPSASTSLKVKRLLNGLVVLLNSLNVEIITEGIETELDFTTCKKMKVNRLQGFYIDKPMSVEDFENKYM